MKVLLGSHFWGLNKETSDKDYLEIYFPTEDELYFNEKLNKDEHSKTKDIVRKDFRLVLSELSKGSLKMVELLFSLDSLENGIEKVGFDSDFIELLKELKPALLETYMDKVCWAVYCESYNRCSLIQKLYDKNELTVEEYTKNFVHVMKNIAVITIWKKTKEDVNNFILTLNKYILNLKKGNIRETMENALKLCYKSLIDKNFLQNQLENTKKEFNLGAVLVPKEKNTYFEEKFKQLFFRTLYDNLATKNLEEQLNEIEKKFLLYKSE